MNISKEFDRALVREETRESNVKSGYVVSSTGRIYDEYLHKESWEALLADMDDAHKKQYGAGGGKELEEKDGKPPKMASFASSSRMIYTHSKEEIPGFVFEKKLSTTVGGMANLDGYLELLDKYIYVEAKCREPYGHKAEQIIKQNYRDVYDYLLKEMPGNFFCEMKDIPEKNTNNPKRNMCVTFFCNGKSVAYFDIKQMICHLLSVATDGLKHPENKDRLFLYFLYNPSGLQMPQDAKNKIMSIYHDTCWAANNYDFKVMFGCIVDYLIQNKKLSADKDHVAKLKNSFNFILCDQHTYKSHFEF